LRGFGRDAQQNEHNHSPRGERWHAL
jgi:hypothetical protein